MFLVRALKGHTDPSIISDTLVPDGRGDRCVLLPTFAGLPRSRHPDDLQGGQARGGLQPRACGLGLAGSFFFLLFIYDSHTERKREAETQAEGEAGSMHREPDMGLDTGSSGSRPGPKAGAKPLHHPGIPWLAGSFGTPPCLLSTAPGFSPPPFPDLFASILKFLG